MGDDVSEFIVAKSDQLNADDLVGGPIVVRIERVLITGGDQPVTVCISGGHQPWKPCKTTMRVLALCWGTGTSAWVGRAVRLFRDPEIKFGGVAVGGIRVSGLSHIDRPQTVTLATSKGKKSAHRIDVLPSAAPPRTDAAAVRDAIAERCTALGGAPSQFRDFLANHPHFAGKTVPPISEWPEQRLAWALKALDGAYGHEFSASLRNVDPESDPFEEMPA